MHRLSSLYLEKDKCDDLIKLGDKEYNYVRNVLRLKVGEQIVVYTKKSKGVYKIKNINKKSIEIEQENEILYKKPDYEFVVIQSAMKREYLDFVIEKYGELGATKVKIVKTDNSVVKIENKTLERLKKLMINGAMQAGYDYLPEIEYHDSIKNLNINTKDKICFYEKENKKVFLNRISKSVSIFIGPEGGFSDDDISILNEKGFRFLSPINGILKAETAGVLFAGMIKSLIDCGRYV